MRKKISIFIIIVTLIGLAAYFLWQQTKSNIENAPENPWTEQSSSENIYYDPLGRFSFSHSGFSATPVEDADGEVLLMQKLDNAQLSFQVFFVPFDESGPITRERILQDIPGMIIQDSQTAVIGKGNLTAFIFKSREENIGDTREVWFVSGEYLYQITAPIALDAELAEMMKTWESQ